MKDALLLFLIAILQFACVTAACLLFMTACRQAVRLCRHDPLPDPHDVAPGWDREPATSSTRSAELITTICMDCGRHVSGPHVDLQEALQAHHLSHGLCPDCYAARKAELDDQVAARGWPKPDGLWIVIAVPPGRPVSPVSPRNH